MEIVTNYILMVNIIEKVNLILLKKFDIIGIFKNDFFWKQKVKKVPKYVEPYILIKCMTMFIV